MKGLLLKEFYNLKFYCLIYYLIDIVVFIIFAVATFYGIKQLDPNKMITSSEAMGLLFTNSVASVSYLLFFPSFLLNISYEIDEKNNVTKFLIGTGVSKGDIVRSKLVVGFASYALPLLLLILISFTPLFSGDLSRYFGVEKIVSSFLIFLSSCLLNIAVVLALICYLDFVKARFISTFLTIVIIGIEVSMYAVVLFYDTPTFNMPTYAIYIFSSLYFVIMCAISISLYLLSLKKYESKEF